MIEFAFSPTPYTCNHICITSKQMKKKEVKKLVQLVEEKLGSGEEGDAGMPETAEKVYFPWHDVLDSMREHHDKVRPSNSSCPTCGGKCTEMYFSSPAWTWRHLCGRAGTMVLCCHCPQQVTFSLEILN